ncbi:MAG TPA: 30S ribosomal protein S4 [Gemmatimonadales bacterium]|jgi:small subunit ribosomal protein S4|nr:30S ribosomal protein S4 [Gemmatimonadales bacterium]
MARYVEANCKLCRREGVKLFLKGAKCLTEKCPVERRPYPSGQHGQGGGGGRGRKTSEYAKQLREKQKVKRIYGLTERQFRNTFDRATLQPGVKGTNLLLALETRLDNIAYRLGLAPSRKAARQLIRHGHVEVNGARVNVPSYRVAVGQEVRVAPASREMVSVKMAQELASRGQPVRWLSVDSDNAAGRLSELPTREAIPVNAQEQLIVELYSK